MTTHDTEKTAAAPSFVEFVAIVAMLMALTALSVDIMLPALPAIDDYFAIADDNDRQLVVTAYMLGFAAGQPLYGPLSDRFGRKPMLMIGLVIFVLASLGTLFAESYEWLLLLRAAQGIGSASPRVVGLAVVRDRFGGRDMARVMSFVMMIFVTLPMIAPALGSGVLLLGSWHMVFLLLLVVGVAIALWMQVRLPETRPVDQREPLSLRWLGHALKQTVTTRETLGYTIAVAFIFGPLLGYINSAQQIFIDVFDLGHLFPLFFAIIAAALALAAFINGRLVVRVGMRPLAHFALVAFVAIAAVHACIILFVDAVPSIWLFSGLIAANLFCFGVMMPNFNAMAMEPLGEIAGTAASFVGAITTAGGAVFGWYVGHLYDGTLVPLVVGYLVLGGIAFLIVLYTERGRLFQPHHAPPH
ncbi:multidrug effflux MFS transporter [Microbaculum marinum]|uniref:Bcr/CflA family efflux transporter n=1 Tax=Microbaculum marinum TaxID=1764581 RepID=A0AAW9REN7_9HYPH